MRPRSSISPVPVPDMMKGTLAALAASASIMSPPRRNSPMRPVGAMPTGLE